MATVFFVLVAIGLGLVLFSSIQNKVPDELGFLRAPAASIQHPNAKVQTYKKWKVTSVGATVELVKQFESPFVVNNMTRQPPSIGVLCNESKLDIRIDSGSLTTGTKTSEVIIGGKAEQWEKGAGTNLFPADARQFLTKVLAADGAMQLTLSFPDAGAFTGTLDTTGLKEMVSQLPTGCQGY